VKNEASRPNRYSSWQLDRIHHRRDDAEWLAERAQDPSTRVILHRGTEHAVIEGDSGRLELARVTTSIELCEAHPPEDWTLLGELDGVVHFAAHIDEPALATFAPDARLEDLRAAGGLVSDADAGLMAMTRGLAVWRDGHRYCGRCGAPTRLASAGHALTCTSEACGRTQYPRIEPAIIVLVHDGDDRCILARAHRHPSGMHSVLAGFVEPGESLEDAVAREVFEEVGVRITDIAYHSSQPWPFPASLMLGFTARATTFDIVVEDAELRTAGWFDRRSLRESREDETFRGPRGESIARRLINEWLEAAP
jgi:NAD+ diphosphatase